MRYFITGCAGFIGSHLTDRLLKAGHDVVGFDNFSSGFSHFLREARCSPHFQFIRGDILNRTQLTNAMRGVDRVMHLAANADVRFGLDHPHKDLEQNTIATFNVLEAMRANHIETLCFASTGSIYGQTAMIPTPEHAPFPIQTSLYGASKLAAEGLIQAYVEGFKFKAYIFRFVSIVGERYSHGHVFDFYRQLRAHPHKLLVLGDGKQRKSYLYVQDCIDAILLSMEKAKDNLNILNLGTDDYCEVNSSIQWICEYLKLNPELVYSGGTQGWVGDNPFIYLDCHKIQSLGWKPQLTIQEGVIKTVEYIQQNEWLLERGSNF